jgi:hypothetical protein
MKPEYPSRNILQLTENKIDDRLLSGNEPEIDMEMNLEIK